MSILTSICVQYKFAEGWHVFQSDDIQGLYIAHRNAETAYNDVTKAIEQLILLNENIQCEAKPELSFNEFIQSLRSSDATDHYTPATVMSSKRYTVLAAAA